MLAREIVDLDEYCGAKARYSFRRTAHVWSTRAIGFLAKTLGLSMLNTLWNFNYADESLAETH